MATSNHIPKPHHGRPLDREPSLGSDWSPGFFERLSAADHETIVAVNELLASIRQARTSQV